MKICYLIQTHQNPEQIYRLIKTIQTSGTDNQIIISHDFTSCNLDTISLEKNNIKVLNGKGGRGNFTSVQSYLNAIKWLVENQIEYDWLIYLSGQDYPIKPIAEIEHFLSTTDYDGFMEYFNVFSLLSHWSIQEGQSRYLFKYQPIESLKNVPNWLKQLFIPIKIINYLQPFFRINLAYEMFGIRRKSLFNKDFLCYGGSFFTTLSRKCVEYLDAFCQKHPEVVEYYQEVCVSDESFLQTILVNSKKFKLCNENKLYFDFSKTQNGRPKVLSISDYNSILQSDAHFARKFDITQDRIILDILDENIAKAAISKQSFELEYSDYLLSKSG
jgi:hypothetical protein